MKLLFGASLLSTQYQRERGKTGCLGIRRMSEWGDRLALNNNHSLTHSVDIPYVVSFGVTFATDQSSTCV